MVKLMSRLLWKMGGGGHFNAAGLKEQHQFKGFEEELIDN